MWRRAVKECTTVRTYRLDREDKNASRAALKAARDAKTSARRAQQRRTNSDLALKIQRSMLCKKELGTNSRVSEMSASLKAKYDGCIQDKKYANSCITECDDEIDLPNRWKLSRTWT